MFNEGCGCFPPNGCILIPVHEIPVLRYLRDWVQNVEALMDKYPSGGSTGYFALSLEDKQFLYWDASEQRWRTMNVSADGLIGGLGIDPDSLSPGSVLVWDSELKKFVMMTLSVWGTEEY